MDSNFANLQYSHTVILYVYSNFANLQYCHTVMFFVDPIFENLQYSLRWNAVCVRIFGWLYANTSWHQEAHCCIIGPKRVSLLYGLLLAGSKAQIPCSFQCQRRVINTTWFSSPTTPCMSTHAYTTVLDRSCSPKMHCIHLLVFIYF